MFIRFYASPDNSEAIKVKPQSDDVLSVSVGGFYLKQIASQMRVGNFNMVIADMSALRDSNEELLYSVGLLREVFLTLIIVLYDTHRVLDGFACKTALLEMGIKYADNHAALLSLLPPEIACLSVRHAKMEATPVEITEPEKPPPPPQSIPFMLNTERRSGTRGERAGSTGEPISRIIHEQPDKSTLPNKPAPPAETTGAAPATESTIMPGNTEEAAVLTAHDRDTLKKNGRVRKHDKESRPEQPSHEPHTTLEPHTVSESSAVQEPADVSEPADALKPHVVPEPPAAPRPPAAPEPLAAPEPSTAPEPIPAPKAHAAPPTAPFYQNDDTLRKTMQAGVVSIGICGLFHRIGVTTQAMCMAGYLAERGQTVLLVEANGHGHIESFQHYYPVEKDTQTGVSRLFDVDMFDSRGLLPVPGGYRFIIYDLGLLDETDIDHFSRYDVPLICAGGKPWELPMLGFVFREPRLKDKHVRFLFTFIPEEERADIRAMVGPLKPNVLFVNHCPSMFSYAANAELYDGMLSRYLPKSLQGDGVTPRKTISGRMFPFAKRH